MASQTTRERLSFGVMKRVALSAVAANVPVPENAVTRYVELSHMKRLLDRLRINCVFDVGANRGQFAMELRRIGFRGRIVSFEPVQSEFDALARTFARDAAWKGLPIALGSANGTATMNVIPSQTVMSSLLQPSGPWPNVETQTVSVKRLDDVAVDLLAGLADPRVMLKMDTQGFDLEVFAGAQGCLASVCALQSEISVVPAYKGMPHYLDALRIYGNAGFHLVNLAVVARTDEGALQELNCLMSR